MIQKNDLIIADGRYYSMDCYQTKLNNNVLVVGTSGSGKTRSIVVPNLLQANGSYIISDPKGTLYRQYAEYLKEQGYKVKKLDFSNPEDSDHYNFFEYIHSRSDVIRIAHMLVYSCNHDKVSYGGDPFWEQSADLLLTALIGYLYEHRPKWERTLENLQKLIVACEVSEFDDGKSPMDRIMEDVKKRDPGSFSYKQYMKFRVAAHKTLRSILITLNSKLGRFDYEELNRMLQYDDIDIHSIGQEKTAVFVIVRDTDRAVDDLANVFYNQVFHELCSYADAECPDGRLPIQVRFIMDDFASSCRIEQMPRAIATIRSRGISVMLMIQAESQLTACYGEDGRTIIGNCDTYVYLGGNDLDTARAVAERWDKPTDMVLNMPVENCIVFRRGERPVPVRIFPAQNYYLITERDFLEQTLRGTGSSKRKKAG